MHSPSPARLTCLMLAVIAVMAFAGCERSTSRPPGSKSGAAPEERSPLATIQQLIAAREASSYQQMSELILPGRDHEVVTTLLAVDEFLHANQVLCDYVRAELSLGLAQSIDHAHWGDHLDVFSRYVELVDERIEDDTATVSFTVDKQLPLRHARLRRVDGVWRYDPGPGYDPQLPAALRRMAQGLREVLDDLKSGQLPAAAIRAEPERLVEDVRVRLLPGVKMLPAPPSAQPNGE